MPARWEKSVRRRTPLWQGVRGWTAWSSGRETLEGAAGPGDKVDRLIRFFFEMMGFRPSFDLDTDDHPLGRVIAGREGHCVGLTAI
jgi:hypothetical protein